MNGVSLRIDHHRMADVTGEWRDESARSKVDHCRSEGSWNHSQRLYYQVFILSEMRMLMAYKKSKKKSRTFTVQ